MSSPLADLARDRAIELTGALSAAGIAVALALVAHFLLFRLFARLARLSAIEADEEVVERLRNPARWSLVVLALELVAEQEPLLAHFWQPVDRFVVPALLGWTAFALVRAFANVIENHAEYDADELAARSRRTRVNILSRTAGFVIVFVTVALMLLGIPGVRNVGVTLMASAGLAGLAVGAAAQPALKSLIAGIQMALTEPVRIGDLVVVDGHTGRVETIRMSFLVLRTWDERRVVVPTSRFLDATFENWTRVGNELTGAVLLQLDPGTEVSVVRAKFGELLAAQELWDRRIGKLQVTEVRPEAIELRLVMSARDSGALFDLRCAVREAMLDWLRQEMPGALIHYGARP